MKMIETLKDERKNSLKEMEENANNKWKKLINLLKKTKKNDQTDEVNSSNNSRLENWNKAIKKMQTEGILEMDNLSKLTGTTDESIINRI